MRIYEEMFIVRPDITDEELDPLLEQVKSIITTGGGTVDKVDKWGVRKLAYRIEKKAEGFFVLVQFQAPNALISELERRLRVNDDVMKYMTVRIDEQLKRNEKLQKKRAARQARRPVMVPAMAASQSQDAAAAPGLPSMPAAPMPAAPEAEMPVAAVETAEAVEVKE